MAELISVESSKYTNDLVQSFADIKQSTFSKFLEKNPIFLPAYYHIEREQSRVDVGTGGIEHELGPRSPIRFVKIRNLPVYNLPELKPEVDYDETGYDIQLDLSEIVVLPHTIRPTPGDYFVIKFPETKEFLFRVTAFRYNTIQSNDYYIFDADLREVGENLEALRQIDKQVVAVYDCVFERVGTDENCFIEEEAEEAANGLADLANEFLDMYKDLYYDEGCNSFVFPTGYDYECGRATYLYDMYLEHFVNESKIFARKDELTLILTPNDILDDRFFYIFTRTLWWAILNKRLDRLHPNVYKMLAPIRKNFSVFAHNDMYVDSVHLALGLDELLERDENENITGASDLPCGMQTWIPIPKNGQPVCGPVWTPGALDHYFGANLIYPILEGSQLKTKNYLEIIIYNYLHDIKMDYSTREIYKSLKPDDIKTFYYLPILIYILLQQYNAYFKSESAL